MLLHGVLDSPDIPLNVSRSYLQSDSNVKKISSHISKKVADKLEELFKTNREDFEKKWDDIKIFIEYGMLSDEKFYERAEKFALFKNTDDKYFTFDEYKNRIEPLQKDKDKVLVYLYATNKEEQYAYIAKAKEKGYDVLVMDSILDSHFVNLLERKFEQTRFVRVDSDVVEKLIPKEDKIPEKLSEQEKEKLKPIIEKEVDTKKITVLLESLEESDQPMVITQNEFMRRYKEMSMIGGGGMGFYGEMPESYNLVVNINHPLIGQILNTDDEEKQKELVCQLTDLALLSNGLLKGEALNKFIDRSVKIIH
jgi:molecular chaperone HtpG